MKNSLLLVSLFSVSTVLAQPDSTRRADSATVDSQFSVLPGMPTRSARLSSHSMLDASLKKTVVFTPGVSVYNTMRGQVPGIYMDPSFKVDTLVWRNTSPLVVIDGVVFNQSIGRYYNMNGFEYDDMRMILGRNGTIPYGSGGNNGAVVLHSKSGEGYDKPVVEFNTYTTYAWTGEPIADSRWQLSNSLAYAQDFGKFDLRVSTNYTTEPPGNGTAKGPQYLRLKVNAGYSLNRFSARVILNGNSGVLRQHAVYQLPGGPVSEFSSRNGDDLLQGNLMLSYKITDWFSVSSQVSRTKLQNEIQSGTTSYSQIRTIDNQLDAGNILLNANKKISNDFSVTGSAGWLFNSTATTEVGSTSTGLTLNRSANATTQSMLVTTEIGFRNKVFVGTDFRRDFVQVLPQGNEYNAYSVFGSYSFQHLIDPSNKILSFAKVRVSTGHNDNLVDNTAPRLGTVSPYASRQRTSAVEVGLEAGFLKDRIQFMMNYYNNKSYAPTGSPAIDPATGYSVTYFGLNYNTSVDGFEMIARMKIVDTKRFNLSTQLVAGWNTLALENQTPMPTVMLVRVGGIPTILPTTGLIPAFAPKVTPDWTGGWQTRATLGRFSMSMLIDIAAGGNFYKSNPTARSASIVGLSRDLSFLPLNPADSVSISASDYYGSSYNPPEVLDRTFIKLRDISLGYQFPLFARMKGFVSLSFRNFLLYTKSGVDPETNGSFLSNEINKSISANFSLQF